MATYKCKVCEGIIVREQGSDIGICSQCGKKYRFRKPETSVQPAEKKDEATTPTLENQEKIKAPGLMPGEVTTPPAELNNSAFPAVKFGEADVSPVSQAPAPGKKKKKKKNPLAIILPVVAIILGIAILAGIFILPLFLNKNEDKKETSAPGEKTTSYEDVTSQENTVVNVTPLYLPDGTMSGSISAGWFHSVGLKPDGTVAVTEFTESTDEYFGQCAVDGWTDIIAVDASAYHTVGLKTDGTVVATKYTGDDEYNCGQLDVDDWSNIIAVSAGAFHTVGLKADGTVISTRVTGDTDIQYDQDNVAYWDNVKAISAGTWHTIGLRNDGTVVAVGDNEDGQCNVSYWTDITAVSAGGYLTTGLKKDGTVVCTSNDFDVSEWKDIVAVSAGEDHIVGLKSDGTVVVAGKSQEEYQPVYAQWNDIVAVSAGFQYTVALKNDGTVVAVGRNSGGQCNVTQWQNIGHPVEEY